MSNSQHPVAHRIERAAGDGTRLLATVMCLPLVDGIFPALVLAGALSGVLGVLEIGLLIFGGSATVAVILAELDGTPRENARSVLAIGLLLVPLAAFEAALAPTIAGLVDLAVFERFAAVVILAVAARTASARVGEILPRPAAIIGLGLLASVDLAGAQFVTTVDAGLVARAAAAAGSGVVFAVAVAWFGPRLRESVELDRFRFGSAVALGVFSLSLLGVVPADGPFALSVLCVTGLFALNPGGESQGERERVGRPTADRSTDGAESGNSDAGTEVETGTDADADADVGGGVAIDNTGDAEEQRRFEDRAPWL
ncbi:hypothetical protein BRD01_07025 [Halobacteriales archaeon QS_8_65_32]|nr:MAG: hypothetical protein BRD01_07025 [Halobacteriales archaeon QS_8_65_32]